MTFQVLRGQKPLATLRGCLICLWTYRDRRRFCYVCFGPQDRVANPMKRKENKWSGSEDMNLRPPPPKHVRYQTAL